MSKYIDLEMPALMDLLVRYTEEYTKMTSYQAFSVEEFTHCKQQLAEIQAAIREKKAMNKEGVYKNIPNYSDSSKNPGSSPNRQN